MGLLTAALLTYMVADAKGRQAVARSLASERAAFHEDRDRDARIRRSRTQWLEEAGSVRSFPCGVAEVVADDELEAWEEIVGEGGELPVIAAEVPGSVVFLGEPPGRSDLDEVFEIGRVPVADLESVDVVDERGVHVAEVEREGFEDPTRVWVDLAWSGPEGSEHDRFLFRSTWTAWEAARRLRRLAAGPAPTSAGA